MDDNEPANTRRLLIIENKIHEAILMVADKENATNYEVAYSLSNIANIWNRRCIVEAMKNDK